MSPVFISTLQTAEGRFPAHRSSSRSAPDAIKSRLFSHRSTPRSSAKAPVSGLGPPPRKATPEVQNFLHLLVQHRSQRATSTRLPRSCSQHLLECPHWASLLVPEAAPSLFHSGGRTGAGFRCLSGGCELPSSGDWDSGNQAFAMSRGSPRAPSLTPGPGLWLAGMLWSPSPFGSR